MKYKFVDTAKSSAQSEIDSHALLGWKVISIAADNYSIFIVFGKD